MLLHFYSFTCAYNHLHQPLEFLPEILSSTSVNLQLLIFLLRVQKIILTIPTNTPFLYTSGIFHVPFLRTTIPTIYAKNVISTSAIWPVQAASRDQWAKESCEIGYYLTSHFFLKQWVVITGGTQTLIPYPSGLIDWCISGSSLWWRCLQTEWQTI